MGKLRHSIQQEEKKTVVMERKRSWSLDLSQLLVVFVLLQCLTPLLVRQPQQHLQPLSHPSSQSHRSSSSPGQRRHGTWLSWAHEKWMLLGPKQQDSLQD